MSRKSKKEHEAEQEVASIRQQIIEFETVCSGTIHRRTKVCGKPTCRCAKDPAARHGPYYEWSRLEGRRLRHTVVTEEEAQLLEKAIANHRSILALLKRWEERTIQALLPRLHSSSGKRKKKRRSPNPPKTDS